MVLNKRSPKHLAPFNVNGKQLYLCLVLFLSIFTVQLHADQWRWELPTDRFSKMNMFERSLYNKASKLLKSQQYRAAAGQFEKFKIQYPDSEFLPYVLFMQGYCLHINNDRNKAIKIFNEVLDYFPDSIDDASAALYFLGEANFENGDPRKGMAAMLEMSEDEDYSQHPLAAGAMRKLADNHFKNQEEEKGIIQLKRIEKNFNNHESRKANESIRDIYLRNGKIKETEEWLLNEEKIDDPEHRYRIANAIAKTCTDGYLKNWNDTYTRFKKKEKGEAMTAFWAYMKSQKKWFDDTNHQWEYYSKAIPFIAGAHFDQKEFQTLTKAAVEWIQTDKDANNKISWLVDRLCDNSKYELAKDFINKISDKNLVAYKMYQLLGHRQGKWEASLEYITILEQSKDSKWAKNGLHERAHVYQHRLRKYEDAIKLYLQIDMPPGTLWSMFQCYDALADDKNALRMLSELESIFSSESSKAAWERAKFYHSRKLGTKTISECKRIMKIYKKSAAASSAHQLLEEYGIATGGGVID